jgi:hypothetical protein
MCPNTTTMLQMVHFLLHGTSYNTMEKHCRENKLKATRNKG